MKILVRQSGGERPSPLILIDEATALAAERGRLFSSKQQPTAGLEFRDHACRQLKIAGFVTALTQEPGSWFKGALSAVLWFFNDGTIRSQLPRFTRAGFNGNRSYLIRIGKPCWQGGSRADGLLFSTNWESSFSTLRNQRFASSWAATLPKRGLSHHLLSLNRLTHTSPTRLRKPACNPTCVVVNRSAFALASIMLTHCLDLAAAVREWANWWITVFLRLITGNVGFALTFFSGDPDAICRKPSFIIIEVKELSVINKRSACEKIAMTKENLRPIDDADLLAYLEGLASPDVKAEIEASPELLARARQLAREEARLRLFLAPVEDENELELLSPGLLERARVEIARLIRPRGASTTNRGARAAQPVVVRGMAGEKQERNPQVRKLAFEAGELFIAVEIALEADHTEQYHLRGYVLGWEEQEAEAAIWCSNSQLSTAKLNDEDEFFVEQLLPGEYQIVITTPNRCIELESFSIS